MNEKKRKKIEAKKSRTTWSFNPVTRVVTSKKKYNRKKLKKVEIK